MYELEFKELERFETPDGKTYEIYPLRVEDMKLVYNFIELNEKRLKFTNIEEVDGETKIKIDEEAVKKIGNKVLYNDLIPLCNSIVDKTVIEVDTDELLPDKYRTIQIVMELASKAIIATTGSSKKSGEGGNPLGVPKNPSDSSGEMSMPSKKKRKKAKKR